MASFALVHGAWHGAWCWERLVAELERRGHRAVAMDLPCDDPAATFETYADVVCAALPRDDDVIVVGHSLAGLTIPLVAARRTVRHLVYLCALLPVPGRSLADQLRDRDAMLDPRYRAGLSALDDVGRTRWVDERLARDILYGDCDDDVAAAAFRRLRPQATAPYAVPCSLAQYPAVRSSYLVCADDKLVDPDWARRTAPERLPAEVVELAGDHSPFLSRPTELADALERVSSG